MVLAAVRYGGALQVREIDQIDRYMTAQGEPNDEDDNEAGRYLLAAPYVAAAAALEEYIRVNRKGSSRPGPPWCGDHDLGEPRRARRRWA